MTSTNTKIPKDYVLKETMRNHAAKAMKAVQYNLHYIISHHISSDSFCSYNRIVVVSWKIVLFDVYFR